MASQLPLFPPPPRTALSGRYHASTRLASSLNTTARGERVHTIATTWLGMRWVAGTLRIKFRASRTVLRGGR